MNKNYLHDVTNSSIYRIKHKHTIVIYSCFSYKNRQNINNGLLGDVIIGFVPVLFLEPGIIWHNRGQKHALMFCTVKIFCQKN